MATSCEILVASTQFFSCISNQEGAISDPVNCLQNNPHSPLRELQGMARQDHYYLYTALPIGLRSAPSFLISFPYPPPPPCSTCSQVHPDPFCYSSVQYRLLRHDYVYLAALDNLHIESGCLLNILAMPVLHKSLREIKLSHGNAGRLATWSPH